MSERMTDGTTMINGHTARFHSQYKTADLYRCYDGGKPRMRYFAVCLTKTAGLVTLEARNLSGIKEEVTKLVVGGL